MLEFTYKSHSICVFYDVMHPAPGGDSELKPCVLHMLMKRRISTDRRWTSKHSFKMRRQFYLISISGIYAFLQSAFLFLNTSCIAWISFLIQNKCLLIIFSTNFLKQPCVCVCVSVFERQAASAQLLTDRCRT